MIKQKPLRQKPSERNQVMWVDSNLKFIREHSIAYPEPSWYITHTIPMIIGLVTLYLTSSILAAFDFIGVHIAYIWVVLYMLMFIEAYKVGMRSKKFYKDLLNRGGEIINPYNLIMIKKNATANLIFWSCMLLIVCAYLGIIIYFDINRQTPHDSIYNIFYYPCLFYSSFNNMFVPGPFIFMDIDEGMLFGNALFSYDVLSGIRPTGRGNGFELYYEGKKVAWGKMPPDDMKYLQDMIEIREKYSDYLSAN